MEDDTLQNVMVLKCVIRCFEMVSGLKVSFYKRKLVGISLDGGTLRGFVALLHCKIMYIPFVNLGIHIGVTRGRFHYRTLL